MPVTVLAPGMKFVNEGLLTIQESDLEKKSKSIQPKIFAKDEFDLNS